MGLKLSYLFLFIFATVACKNEIEVNPEVTESENLQIIFSTKGSSSRTLIQSSANIQNVKNVHLYIFQGNDENSICILNEDIDWRQPTGDTQQQVYKVKGKLIPGQQYILLAVGLDDESKVTYGLPDALPLGVTLSKAMATLQGDKTVSDIAQSELFAGSTPIRFSGENDYAHIELKRRVAGVLGYFKNIPYLINGSKVSTLEVVIYENQNSQIALIEKQLNDFGQVMVENSTSLLSIDLSGYSKSSDGNYYEIPISDENGLLMQENCVLQGAYVIPKIGSEDINISTFSIQLLDASRNLLKTYLLMDGSSNNLAKNFNIKANHFYSIGKKKSSDSIEEDLPIDLSLNTDVIIQINPNWENIYDIPIKP